MNDVEAMKRILKGYVSLHEAAFGDPEDMDLEAVDRVYAIITTAENAGKNKDGATDLALKVLENRGFKVLSIEFKDKANGLRTFLDVSTAHLTPESCKWLEDQVEDDVPMVVVDAHGDGYGFWLYIGEHLEGVPEDIVGLMDYAKSRCAEWLLIDRDAEEVDGLKTYEWSK